jgi:hypothetical protein
MEYKDFFEASISLQNFIKEQDKLKDVLKVISPSSTGVCEFGNVFIDDYIRVVEIALGDKNQWFSWFAFDNDFGKNRMVVKVNDKAYKICDERQFYDVCIKLHNDDSDKLHECDVKKDVFLKHLSKLKSPYAEQAIENYDAKFTEDVNIKFIYDIEQALNYAFDWHKSPQGTSYWNEIYINIVNYLK